MSMKSSVCLVVGLTLGSPAATVFAQSPQFSAGRPSVQTDPAAKPNPLAFPEGARVAFVDVDQVAALSLTGRAAAARLHELRSQKAAELSERGKEVDALQAKLARNSTGLTDLARRRLEREFQRAQVDFQRFTEDAQEEVRELQQELLQEFTAQLFPVIADIAKEKNLWAVFSSEAATLWHDSALDMSVEVARRLDDATKR
jgi:Skp family chaperone for outer membrane proteins